jgi:hypothetical protein
MDGPAQHPMSISSHFVVRKLSVFIVVCITREREMRCYIEALLICV